jgi:hypothetical protein
MVVGITTTIPPTNCCLAMLVYAGTALKATSILHRRHDLSPEFRADHSWEMAPKEGGEA